MQAQVRFIQVRLMLAVFFGLVVLSVASDLRTIRAASNGELNPIPEPSASTPSIQSFSSISIPQACLGTEKIRRVIANGYVAFIDSTPLNPQATPWPETDFNALVERYRHVIQDGYAGPKGFSDLNVWAREFGVGKVPAECPNCQHAGNALRVMYVPGEVNKLRWYESCGVKLPSIQHGSLGPEVPTKGVLYHELAHLWDNAPYESRFGLALETRMELQRSAGVIIQDVYQRSKQTHGEFATGYSLSNPIEHLAETVEAYFLTNEYIAGSLSGFDLFEYETQIGKCWSDEDPRCPPGKTYTFDRYDFVKSLFEDAYP